MANNDFTPDPHYTAAHAARPGSAHPDAVTIHVPVIDRDSARKHRAALASRKVNDHQQQVDSLRQRCHSIIDSWEHMESDKDIALLALEALAEGKRL